MIDRQPPVIPVNDAVQPLASASKPSAPASTGARRRFWSPRRVGLALLAVGLVVVLIVGLVALRVWRLFPGGGDSAPAEGRINLLLLGTDTATWRQEQHPELNPDPDSVTLVSVNAVTGRTVVFSLPRNLEAIPFPPDSPLAALYPQGYSCQLACYLATVYSLGLAHADLYPNTVDAGLAAVKDAVRGITGLSVNYTVMVDLDGFENLVDALGGVTITVGQRIPVGASGKLLYWIEPGEHHFTGDEALWYVRSRLDTDDYQRMNRQGCLMASLVDQIDPATVVTRLLPLLDAAQGSVTSDIPVDQLAGLAKLAAKARQLPVELVRLTPPLVDPSRPDYPAIASLVRQAIAAADRFDAHPELTDTATHDLHATCE